MKIKPLFDRVLIKPDDFGETTKCGLVIPTYSQERSQYGVVVETGDSDKSNSNAYQFKVKVGDKVLYNRYAGCELKIDDKKYILIKEIDIIGVVNDRENY